MGFHFAQVSMATQEYWLPESHGIEFHVEFSHGYICSDFCITRKQIAHIEIFIYFSSYGVFVWYLDIYLFVFFLLLLL